MTLTKKHPSWIKAHEDAVRRGTAYIDNTHVREHVAELRRSGMTLEDIGEAADLHPSSVRNVFRQKRITLFVATALLDVEPLPAGEVSEGRGIVPKLGLCRKLQGAVADGYSLDSIAKAAGFSDTNAIQNHTENPDGWVSAATERHLWETVDNLLGTPFKSASSATRTRNWARRKDWATSVCWDADTIRDPSAVPQWTGLCGTWRGWWAHKEELHHVQFPRTLATGEVVWVMACAPCRYAKKERDHRTAWERTIMRRYGYEPRRGVLSAEDQALRDKIIASHEEEYQPCS